MCGLGLEFQRVGVHAVDSYHPHMGLLRHVYQVCQKSNLVAIGLELAKNDVVGMKRAGNGIEVALPTRQPQDLRVSNHLEPSYTFRGELCDEIVRHSITQATDIGNAGLVIEAHHGDNGRGAFV